MQLTRRELSIAAGSCLMPLGGAARSAETSSDLGRIAIVDCSNAASKYIADLKDPKRNLDIKVIARYMARQCQPSVSPDKRIAFNRPHVRCGGEEWRGAPEADLLLENGFALLTVYQYNSSSPRKFVTGLSDLPVGRRKGVPVKVAAYAEAEADAKAVTEQSKLIHHPDAAPVYFGVDFDFPSKGVAKGLDGKPSLDNDSRPIEAGRVKQGVLHYFERLKSLLGDRLGAYGNGLVNETLKFENLIRFSWVSESRGFERTPRFLRSKQWTLFQNQIDRRWFLAKDNCGQALKLDTNVQNPETKDIGAWNGQGLYTLPIERTRAIFDQRIVSKLDAIELFRGPDLRVREISKTCRKDAFEIIGTSQRHRTVRRLERGDGWLRIDVDDNGSADGYCRLQAAGATPNFLGSIFEMPDW